MECAKLLNGSVSEGFVARDWQFNRIKIKSPNYVALQHNVKPTPQELINIVVANEEVWVFSFFFFFGVVDSILQRWK